MNDLLELVSLQLIDDDLDAARAELVSIETRLAGNDELSAARERLAELDAQAADAARRQRASDAALEDLGERIAREERKLYDGSIKQFKELQALEGDVGHLKADRSSLEDAALTILTELEATSTAHSAAAAEAERLERDWALASADLRAQQTRLADVVAKRETARQQQVEQVTVGSLRLYEGLRKRKAGKAVARVQGASCSACRVTIPDAIRRRVAHAPPLVQCPQCERILAPG